MCDWISKTKLSFQFDPNPRQFIILEISKHTIWQLFDNTKSNPIIIASHNICWVNLYAYLDYYLFLHSSMQCHAHSTANLQKHKAFPVIFSVHSISIM